MGFGDRNDGDDASRGDGDVHQLWSPLRFAGATMALA